MYTPRMINRIYRKLLDNNIFINNIINKSTSNLEIQFTIKSAEFNKFENVITSQYPKLDCSYKNISKISIIGYGIMNDATIITKTMQILDTNALEVLNIQTNESKIRIIFKDKLGDNILEQLHNELIV